MKYLIVAVFFAAVMAGGEPDGKTYAGLREHLENKIDETTLVMFYDPSDDSGRKGEMIQEVQDKILADTKHSNYHFFQVQINPDQVLKEQKDDVKMYEDPCKMVKEYGINVLDLRHRPTITAFRHGWETLVNGKGSVDVLASKIEDFDKKAKQKKNDQEKKDEAAAAGNAAGNDPNGGGTNTGGDTGGNTT